MRLFIRIYSRQVKNWRSLLKNGESILVSNDDDENLLRMSTNKHFHSHSAILNLRDQSVSPLFMVLDQNPTLCKKQSQYCRTSMHGRHLECLCACPVQMRVELFER